MTKNPWDVLKQGANVTVDVPIGSKYHCGRFDLGRFVKAPNIQDYTVTGYMEDYSTLQNIQDYTNLQNTKTDELHRT